MPGDFPEAILPNHSSSMANTWMLGKVGGPSFTSFLCLAYRGKWVAVAGSAVTNQASGG